MQRALSGARPENSCFSLDSDLHGCRLLSSNGVVTDELPVIRPASPEHGNARPSFERYYNPETAIQLR